MGHAIAAHRGSAAASCSGRVCPQQGAPRRGQAATCNQATRGAASIVCSYLYRTYSKCTANSPSPQLHQSSATWRRQHDAGQQIFQECQ
jgi:hypothetical protein